MAKQRTSFSPYSIGLYVKCPKQYYFEYLDNYTSAYPNKQNLKQIQIEAGKRKELIFGELLHITLNLFFHLPEGERTEEKLLALPKEVWKGPRGKTGGFPKVEEEREWYQEALNILKNFAQTQNLSPLIAYLPKVEKEGEFVEANFLKVPLQFARGERRRVPLSGTRLVQIASEVTDLILAGKIDRIDKDPPAAEGEPRQGRGANGGYHLIDYKTGKSEGDDEFQLMVYSILAEEALGKPPAKASYLYLRSGNLKSFQPSKETKDGAKARVLKIAEQIRNEKEFPPHPTKICYYCNYLEFCPAKEEAKRLIAAYKGEDEIAALPF